MDESIWVLAIEHKYGVSVSLYSGRALAEAGLKRYVAEWWGDIMEPEDELPEPLAPDDIQFYFERAQEEYWIESVILDEDELEIGTSRG